MQSTLSAICYPLYLYLLNASFSKTKTWKYQTQERLTYLLSTDDPDIRRYLRFSPIFSNLPSLEIVLLLFFSPLFGNGFLSRSLRGIWTLTPSIYKLTCFVLLSSGYTPIARAPRIFSYFEVAEINLPCLCVSKKTFPFSLAGIEFGDRGMNRNGIMRMWCKEDGKAKYKPWLYHPDSWRRSTHLPFETGVEWEKDDLTDLLHTRMAGFFKNQPLASRLYLFCE